MLNQIRKYRGKALLAGLFWIALGAHGANTDIANIPMAVQNNVSPNFMFMIDSSGSMTNIVPEAPYSATTTYLTAAQCSGRQPYAGYNTADLASAGGLIFDLLVTRIGTTSKSTPKISYNNNTYTFGTSGTAKCFDPTKYYNAHLVADGSLSGSNRTYGTGYLDAVYSGNFLNWYYGLSTNYTQPDTNFTWNSGAGDRKPGTQTRLEIAKTASKATLDALPQGKVRVGLSSYHNSSEGGRLLEGIGNLDSSKISATKNSIDTLTSSGSTPLSETLGNIGRYFTLPLPGTRNLTLDPDGTPYQKTITQVFEQDSSGHDFIRNSAGTDVTSISGCSPSPVTSPGPSPATPNCPIQYWCQRSYAVLLTDGRPYSDLGLSSSAVCNYAGQVGNCNNGGKKTNTSHTGHLGGAHSYEANGSDYLDDMAQALFEIDLRPDLVPPPGRAKKNNMRTYTIGFADDQAKDDPLLQEAAAQGGGLFNTADDTSSLVRVMKKAVDDALSKDAASAAVAVVNTQITIDNTAYASSYDPGQWTGDLEAFRLNTSTGIPIQPRVWAAKPFLDDVTNRTPGNRNIVTYGSTSGVEFTAAATGLDANLVDYMRGNRSLEGTTYRKRDALLGDIINAEPVVVKYGTTPIVFQAANDGMLHVFNGSTPTTLTNPPTTTSEGQEIWAYIPKLVQTKLANYASPTYVHTPMVDATPAIADVSGTFTGKLLVGGLGAGGKGYYGLDITSYTAASQAAYALKAKWEALGSAANAGLSFGTPLIVNTAAGWKVLVASGYNNNTGGGTGRGYVFVLNPNSGTVEATIDTGAGDTISPAGLAHLSKRFDAAPADVIPYVYGGDLLGNVWRIDLTNATVTNWTARKIATLTDASGNYQPISTPPAVRANGNTYSVYVGTGLYLGNSDVPGNTPQNQWATQRQTMYGILDDTAIASPTLPVIRGTTGSTCPGNGAFICQTAGSFTNNKYVFTDYPLATGNRGWYVDLPTDLGNGRVVTTPQLTSGGALAFTVNIPTNVPCDPGGSSYFFAVDALNGGAIEQTYGQTDYWPTGVFLGNALASRPVIVETSDGKRAVIRMSDRGFQSPKVPEPPPLSNPPTWRRVYWREL